MRIERFEDVLRALREHPEWLDEVRAIILTEELLALPSRFTQLEQRQDRTEQRQDRMEQRLEKIDIRLARLDGEAVERRYRRHGAGYFGPIARRIRLLSVNDRDDLLDRLEEEDLLSRAEVDDVRLADAIFTARHEDRAVYLLLEASKTIGPFDVKRAARRAELLSRVGTPTLPIVAGEHISEETTGRATAAGVWVVTNGSVTAPAA